MRKCVRQGVLCTSKRWEPDKAFKEISVDLLSLSAWKRVDKDAIHNVEAPTPTKACDRLSNVSIFMGFTVLIVGDILAMTLAHARRPAS